MLWMKKVKHQQYVCMLVDAAVHLAIIINFVWIRLSSSLKCRNKE